MYRIAQIRALAQKVLAVAAHDGRDWIACIGAVPGVSHEKEAQEVLDHGDKATQALAEVLFPTLASRFAWRE